LLEVRNIAENRQALSPPASKVWNKDVRAKVQLRFKKYPPPAGATGATGASIEGIKIPSDNRGSACMRRRRPWGCDQFPVDDLSDQDVWDLE